jgi:hypothetical protein
MIVLEDSVKTPAADRPDGGARSRAGRPGEMGNRGKPLSRRWIPLLGWFLAQSCAECTRPATEKSEPAREQTVRGAEVRGRATDQDGKPVADREIWLVGSSLGDMVQADPAYLCAEDERQVEARARTDRDGRFRIGGAPYGRARLGIAPAAGIGVAPLSVEIEIEEDEPERQIDLHTWRGLSIRGRALLPDGAPAAACRVEAKLQHWLLVGATQTDEHGAFAIGALAPGDLSLQAIHPGRLAPSDEIVARTGDAGIELRLRAAGSLRASVVDRGSGKPEVATVYVTHLGSGGCTQHAGVSTLSLDRLEPGSYDLAAISDDGRAGIARGVEVRSGALSDGVKIGIGPGARLTLRLAGGPKSSGTFRLSSGDACLGWVSLELGRSASVSVPPGTIRIASMKDVAVERTVEIGEGGEQTVALGER